ncbi:MAG: hypothetical protein ACRCWC_00280 [Plesiomonas shigelloides]
MPEDLSCHKDCEVHDDMVQLVSEISEGFKWMKSVGRLMLAVIGGACAILIPMMVGFFVYLAKVDSRLANIEYRMAQMERQYEKVHQQGAK